jgi:hypothetical protein
LREVIDVKYFLNSGNKAVPVHVHSFVLGTYIDEDGARMDGILAVISVKHKAGVQTGLHALPLKVLTCAKEESE